MTDGVIRFEPDEKLVSLRQIIGRQSVPAITSNQRRVCCSAITNRNKIVTKMRQKRRRKNGQLVLSFFFNLIFELSANGKNYAPNKIKTNVEM